RSRTVARTPAGGEGTTGPVLAIDGWTSNAALVADAARLGYIAGKVLDLTHNTGKFWQQFQPTGLVTNDIDPSMPTNFHDDCRRTRWSDASFDTVVLDLPYKLAGTPASPGMDRAYGTTTYRSLDALTQLHVDACDEAIRISSRWVLVKTMDQVCGGKVRWLTDDVSEHMKLIGWKKIDALLFRSYRPQDPARGQQHARRNYSTLLVFQRPSMTTGPDSALVTAGRDGTTGRTPAPR
ncbi:MAG: hypothetical protein ACYCWW_18460, partial [Deltaproteobacteria bacterium]